MSEKERIEQLEEYVESLQSLIDTLVEGLDIRSKINRDLKQRIKKQESLFCPLLRDSCRRDKCVAFVDVDPNDYMFTCNAFDITVSTKQSEVKTE